MARQKNFQNGAQGEAGTAAIDKLLPPPASRLQAEQRWVALALPHHLGLRPGAVDDCAALCQPRPNIHDKVQTSGPEAVHEHRCVGAKAAGVVVPRAARRAAQQRAVELLQDGLGHCAARVGKESRKGWVGRWPGRREEGAQGFVEDAGRQPQHSRLRCAAPLSFHRQKDIRHRTRTYFTCHTPSKERTQKLATGRPGGGGGSLTWVVGQAHPHLVPLLAPALVHVGQRLWQLLGGEQDEGVLQCRVAGDQHACESIHSQ